MFTGLIQAVGKLTVREPRAGGVALAIHAPSMSAQLKEGESVAVEGCCLTVAWNDAQNFGVFASQETLNRTTFGSRRVGGVVNLERALAVGDRLGGHYVQGHVDGLGTVRDLIKSGEAWTLRVELPERLHRYVVEKGSIAFAGISLTVAAWERGVVDVAVIPITWRDTSMHDWRVGDSVHIEVDILAKYVEAQVKAWSPKGAGVTMEALGKAGFIR